MVRVFVVCMCLHVTARCDIQMKLYMVHLCFQRVNPNTNEVLLFSSAVVLTQPHSMAAQATRIDNTPVL